MKAVVLRRYGSVDGLSIEEVETPAIKPNQIRVKVRAATLNFSDLEMRTLRFPWYFKIILRLAIGVFRPRAKILGQELSGVVDEVGAEVTRFSVGDEVIATTGFSMGAHAEYIALSTTDPTIIITKKPEALSFEDATTIPLGGRHAVFFLEKAGLKSGDEVLINGAGGTIGTYAIQVAKQIGATVTAVDSTGKLEMMKSLGADHVIDYLKQDFATMDKKYDVVFDIVGRKSFNRSIAVLKDDGYYVGSNPLISHIFKGGRVQRKSNKKVFAGTLKEDVKELDYIATEIAEGRMKAAIDKVYTLDEAIEGHRYLETGEKLGHLVIVFPEN
ncbi:MAG: NAD(P)-dependent alcohol dehydrogenase [Candidatus Kariarchaeaceae archaeon]